MQSLTTFVDLHKAIPNAEIILLMQTFVDLHKTYNLVMPRLGKRKIHLLKARKTKLQYSIASESRLGKRKKPILRESESECTRPRNSDSSDPEPNDLEYDSSSDSDFNPTEALQGDPELLIKDHVKEWIESLPRDTLFSLALFLFFVFVGEFGMQIGAVSKVIAKHLNRHFRTIQDWRLNFLDNGGEVPDDMRGKYERSFKLESHEDLCTEAKRYVRAHAFVKGAPNMTVSSFTSWVNKTLLPNSALDPGFPRSISCETGRRWLHSMGFFVKKSSKGIYVDGHERPDVVDSRKTFIYRMVELGFLHSSNAPNENAAACLPPVTSSVTENDITKTIIWFHDESTFNANEDQTTQWGDHSMQVIRPKSKGAGLMVSDFVEEKGGYLALSDAEYDLEKELDASIKQSARVLFEYGNNHGYWDSEKFLKQMDDALKIAEIKYPPSGGYRHVFLFDHSCGHTAYSKDALVASRMNRKDGGKQPRMRDTVWEGNTQRMLHVDGTPKGVETVLKERGLNVSHLTLPQMKVILENHDDFKNESTALEHKVEGRGHVCLFIPKYHCEINPIERVWAQSKKYTRAYCNYRLPSLRETVPRALDSVSVTNIANFCQRARHYMYAYLDGATPSPQMEDLVNKFLKQFKSHRRVGLSA